MHLEETSVSRCFKNMFLRSVFLVVALCLCRTCMSQECVPKYGGSGSIESRGYSRSRQCWKIFVPTDTYTTLILRSFTSYGANCQHASIDVEITGKSTEHRLCSGQSHWTPIIAFNDATVVFHVRHNDAAFRIDYHSENIACSQRDSVTCSDGLCVPGSKVCDGKRDCVNGDDEAGCTTGVFAVNGIEKSRNASIDWLMDKQSLTSGWKENTHRVVTALFLATERNVTFTDLKEELMVKQLEVQILSALLRNNTEKVSTNQLSLFVNSLLVTCQNPRNFYGYDLVAVLKNQVEQSSLTAHPVAYLALCNANETLPVDAITNFEKIMKNASEYPFHLDFQAVAVLSMACLSRHREGNSNSSLTRTEQEAIVNSLKTLQLEDGSFGNIYTTAIVTQALLSSEEEIGKDWKVKQAVQHLIHHLNSSSVNFLSTYLILPIFNGKSLSDIGKTNCSGTLRYYNDPVDDVRSKMGPKMRIQYSLYIGDQKDIIHTIFLLVPFKEL